MIRDQAGQHLAQAKLLVGTRQQQHATIRGEATAIEGGGHLLAAHGWQREWQQGIVAHGGCGSFRLGRGLVSTPKSLRYLRGLHHIRQRIPAMHVNKMG